MEVLALVVGLVMIIAVLVSYCLKQSANQTSGKNAQAGGSTSKVCQTTEEEGERGFGMVIIGGYMPCFLLNVYLKLSRAHMYKAALW